MVTWTDSLTTGIEDIDRQHRELVRRFNSFAEGVQKGYDKKRIIELLLFMRAYATYHFGTEEDMMRKVNYDRLDVQRIEHEDFNGKQQMLFESAKKGDDETARKVLQYLEEWISRHISLEDKQFGEWLNNPPRQGS